MSNIDTTFYGTNVKTADFKNDTTSTNSLNLEDRLFFTLLHKNIAACSTKSPGDEYCKKFFESANNTISARLQKEYINASTLVYSNPVDPITVNFTGDECLPSKGKNRTKKYNGKYTFPIIKNHDSWITNEFGDNITNIKNLKKGTSGKYIHKTEKIEITFTRTNDTIPETYDISKIIACADEPFRTEGEIKTLWSNNTGCTSELDNVILGSFDENYYTLQYIENKSDITKKFAPFTKSKLLSDKIAKNIKWCSPGGFINVLPNDIYNASDILVAGLLFEKSNVDRVLLQNNNFKLYLNTGGNLALYQNDKLIWHADKWGKGTYVGLQYDGNFILYDVNKTPIWASNTDGNSDAKLQLNSKGTLRIIDKNGTTKKNIVKDIDFYIKNTFYDNCPNALFSDKKGRVWKFEWGDYDNGKNIDQVPSNDGTKNRFRGFHRGSNDWQWNVNQLKLDAPEGYNTKLDDAKPVKADDGNFNYNSNNDIYNFDKIDRNQKRLPTQLGGVEKPNFIPGYIRISDTNGTSTSNTNKFLVMSIDGDWNQAFILYQKYHDTETFFKHLKENYPKFDDFKNKISTHLDTN
jgi:hypothetical protein